MAKYIINDSASGYETVQIDDTRILEPSTENTTYIILDNSTNDKLIQYYNIIKQLLQLNQAVYIIMVGDESKIRRSICNLMALYHNYNIYKVDSIELINSAYLATLANRQVSYDEISTYLSSDILAYSDIDTIMLGIDSLIKTNDLEGLKTLLENHYMTIEAFPDIVNYMRKVIDTTNTGEMQDKLDKYRKQASTSKVEADTSTRKLRESEQQVDDLQSSLKDIRRQLVQSKADVEELKAMASSNGPVIRTYSSVNTQLLQCKTQIILYIKEITYIPYANSFISMLTEIIKNMRYTVKLLVFDNSSGTSILYKPLQQVNAAEFQASKDRLMNNSQTIIVNEPSPMILSDILQSINPVIDVVVIYDRMHQVNDLVVGNNVYKYWVINSFSDYEKSRSTFRIDNTENIITRSSNTKLAEIAPQALDIPKIAGYENEKSVSGYLTKYKTCETLISKQPLMTSVLRTCHITPKKR